MIHTQNIVALIGLTSALGSWSPRLTTIHELTSWEPLDIDISVWKSRRELLYDTDNHLEYFDLEEIYKLGATGVYRVIGTHRVLVYRMSCGMINRVGTDYWFLNHLKDSGLVPRVHAISATLTATQLESTFGGKTQTDGKINMKRCLDGSVPEVRYILMDRAKGDSVLEQIPRTDNGQLAKVPIKLAAEITFGMIELLQQIHSHGIVHGDAHFGNFIMKGNRVVQMIDFEMAKLAREENICIESPPEEMVATRWSSPWEARGCPLSFRDDIHRVMVCFAAMIYGNDYINYFNALSLKVYNRAAMAEGRKELDPIATRMFNELWIAHRTNGHIFNVDGFDDAVTDHELDLDRFKKFPRKFVLTKVLQGMGASRIAEISNKMDKLERYVISITERPNYEYIMNLLDEIVELAAMDEHISM
jgi:hypothetical protein